MRLSYLFLMLSLVTCASLLKAAEQQLDKTSQGKNKNKTTAIQQTQLGMNISGNKELPNVLYIVPWKSNVNFANQPQATRLLDEIYAPVDPYAFTKKVKFYHQLTDKTGEQTKD